MFIRMILLLAKRVLALFVAALFTLIFDAEPAYGVDKAAAVKNCENGLKSLEQQRCRLVNEIKGAYGRTIQDVRDLIIKLKLANEPQIILSLSKDCQDGLSAIDWLITRYGKSVKTVEVREVSTYGAAKRSLAPKKPDSFSLKGGCPKAKADKGGKVTNTTKAVLSPGLVKIQKKPELHKSIVSVKSKSPKLKVSSLKSRRNVET
jgi:hypothetical protein